MIVEKIKSRGDGRQLGHYLLDDPKNDEAELIDVRGFEAGHLADAFDRAETEARGKTRVEKVFSFAVIAPEDGETLTREQLLEAVDEAERALGYTGLDRAVVRHLKGTRRENEGDHYHIVWNRFDHDTGKIRSDSHHGRKMREAMDRIEERFNLRQRDRTAGPDPMRSTDAEARQDERSAKPKAARMAEITELWNSTATGQDFRDALDAAGYTLARGERRAFCVVDERGEIHSLAKQIAGAKTADVKARLADLDPLTIPEAAAVRAAILQASAERRAAAGLDPDEPSRPSRTEREAGAAADAAAIRDAEAMDYEAGPHIPTPRERTEAERAASTGMAAAVLERVTFTRSTFTRADLEREAARMTGHTGREAWMSAEGGLDGLDDQQRASAERSYEKWAEDNPRAAAKYGLEDYVSYAQEKEAERQAEADPASLRERAERREAWRQVMAAIDASGELVAVGPDPRDIAREKPRERYTTRAMLATELSMEAAAASLAERGGHGVKDAARETVREQIEAAQGWAFGADQLDALRHVTGHGDLSLVVGYAGAGKSSTLNVARGAWEAEGYRVRGTALSGMAARGLEDSAGIKSVNLHRLLHRLDNEALRGEKVEARTEQLQAKLDKITGKSEKAQKYRADLTRQISEMRADLKEGQLGPRDVIVVDEAAMVGSRQMGRLFAHAARAGAKLVLVGDHEQVQAIEAGAAFRALMDRHGAATMKDVRRQHEDWQKAATTSFAEQRTSDALDAYRKAGMTHEAASRADAKADLVAAWAKARETAPDASSVIVTHRNADVQELNTLARAAYRAEGRLGDDHDIALKDGELTLATGDRLLFRKNDGQLDVVNGSLGTVRQIKDGEITAQLDTAQGKAGQGREVTFAVADYQEFAHGYAATVHKTQGATVDRAFVLATPGMDRHTAYVAMTRHRDGVDLFYGRDDFKGHDAMARRLSRDGAKDSVLDYTQRAEQGRGFAPSLRAAIAGVWAQITGLFRRGEHHPAEAAEQRREADERAARRPGERFTDAMGVTTERIAPTLDPAFAKERVGKRPEAKPIAPPPKTRQTPTEKQAPATAKPTPTAAPTAPEPEAAPTAPETIAERWVRQQREIEALREAERRRDRDRGNEPGGRG